MKRNLYILSFVFIFYISCSEDSTSNSEKFVDIDILNFADIAIS